MAEPPFSLGVEEEGFEQRWQLAGDATGIREVLLRNDRFLSLELEPDNPGSYLIGKAVRDIGLPPGCLVAVIHRGEETIIPRGDTILANGDLLTIIGEPDGIIGTREHLGLLSKEPILDDD